MRYLTACSEQCRWALDRKGLGRHPSHPKADISNSFKTAVSFPGNMQLSSLTTKSPSYIVQMQMSILDLSELR